MSRRSLSIVFLAVVCLLLTSGVGAAETGDRDLVEPCAAEVPDDFGEPAAGNETIGWFDGYWYNEPVDVDASDGLTDAELEALSARTAARFEAMRCLAFEELPPVESVDREEFTAEIADQYAEVDEETRLFDNARFETMLMIGSDEDSVDVRGQDRAVTVGGYYDFENDEIVVVSDDEDRVMVDEAILAHELGHALQDQHFDLAGYERPTTDVDKGKLGVIEGDVHRIEHRYLEYCHQERWNEPCVLEDGQEVDDDLEGPPSWGLYFMEFQPYSDGPAFVDYVYEDGGWEAVNDLYEEMPRSALQVISPEKYGEIEPTELEVDDRSVDEWDRLAVEGQRHDRIGKAGLAAMFMDQFEDPGPIVSPMEYINRGADGMLDETNPIDYGLEVTDGWRGDRFYAYHAGDDRTGTVWKLAWTDGDAAETFADAYEELIDHRNGEPVEGYENVYAFGEESDFEGAVTLYTDDDRLWIVTAPSVEELPEIHDEVRLLEDDESDGIPGFGITVAVATLVGFVAVRRVNTR